MSDDQIRINNLVNQLVKGVLRDLKTVNEHAYIEDRVSKIRRSRVNAEFCSTLVNLHNNGLENYYNIIEKLAKGIVLDQNKDGSWNEKHLNYDNPSSVFTSICALSLLDVKETFPEMSIEDNVFENAARFLIRQEISSGHFRKSEQYHADVLNADAMVAAFLVRIGTKYHNDDYIKAGERALLNVCKQQFTDGGFPYGGPTKAHPYKYHLHVPCIHYQTVTLYYLMKSLPLAKSDWLTNSINQGIKWLLQNQVVNGTFSWKKSGLNFALYLTATYALSVPLYLRYITIDNRAQRMIIKCIDILEKQIVNDILLRWEKGSFGSVLKGILDAPIGGFIGEYPLSFKILRSLHRIHREIARSEISENITASKLVNRTAGGYSSIMSTVESSTNYPDMYMTTEALEALSSVLVKETVAH